MWLQWRSNPLHYYTSKNGAIDEHFIEITDVTGIPTAEHLIYFIQQETEKWTILELYTREEYGKDIKNGVHEKSIKTKNFRYLPNRVNLLTVLYKIQRFR